MALFGSKKAPAKKVTPADSSVAAAAATAKKARGTGKSTKAAGKGGLADVMKTIQQGSKAPKAAVVVEGLKNVIRKPRITEKAANMTSINVYTFDITQGASKHDVVRAVKALYKVTPVKVNVVNTRGKRMPLKTRRGFGIKNDNRKAYVYLKAGDKIDFA